MVGDTPGECHLDSPPLFGNAAVESAAGRVEATAGERAGHVAALPLEAPVGQQSAAGGSTAKMPEFRRAVISATAALTGP